MKDSALLPGDYQLWLATLKQRVRSAQQRAILSVNCELVLLYVRRFAEEWPESEFVQQAVAQLPWGHNLLLLTKLKTRSDRKQHRIVAEYALRGMTQPIGVAEYKLQLPDELARYLPSIDQIESGLQDAASPGGEDTPA